MKHVNMVIKKCTYLALIRIGMALREHHSHVVVQVKAAFSLNVHVVTRWEGGWTRFGSRTIFQVLLQVGTNKTEM